MVSDVVESVHQVSPVGLGDLYLGDVVERRKKYAVVAVDYADISDIDYELLMGPDEIRTIPEDGLCCCLALQDDSFEVVEYAFPDFPVRHVAEID